MTAAAQALAHNGPSLASPTTVSDLSTYAKLGAAVITGIATLLGLPLVLLTYRKTRAEITKIELESNSLRQVQASQGDQSKVPEGSIQIIVDRSKDTNIQVLADPRFLAPLLVLLDFIFASVVIRLAGLFFEIFSLDFIQKFAMGILAIVLFLPIGRQVLRVRAVLRAPRTPDEVHAALTQSRVAIYTTYAVIVLSLLLTGTLVLTLSGRNRTQFESLFAWGLIVAGTLLVCIIPFAKTRCERYLTRAYESQNK